MVSKITNAYRMISAISGFYRCDILLAFQVESAIEDDLSRPTANEYNYCASTTCRLGATSHGFIINPYRSVLYEFQLPMLGLHFVVSAGAGETIVEEDRNRL